MSIQKIKSGRVQTITPYEFIGQIGTIFYDELIGDLRISDGVTPGGLPIMTGRAGVSFAPPLIGDEGELYWNMADSALYVSIGGQWINTAAATTTSTGTVSKASKTNLGVVKIGDNLSINADGVIANPLTMVTTEPMAIIGNRCILPSTPVGDIVHNLAIVYTAPNVIEEHGNISIVVDGSITYLVFNDSVFSGGETAVVSYAAII